MNKQKSMKLVREERAKYMREWRKKNPEKVREINDRYWLKRAERATKEAE